MQPAQPVFTLFATAKFVPTGCAADVQRWAQEFQKVPTILRVGPYRFFFFSNENNEPAHIHVQ